MAAGDPAPVWPLPGVTPKFATWSVGGGRPASCTLETCERWHAGIDLTGAPDGATIVAPEDALVVGIDRGWSEGSKAAFLRTKTGLFLVLGGFKAGSHKEFGIRRPRGAQGREAGEGPRLLRHDPSGDLHGGEPHRQLGVVGVRAAARRAAQPDQLRRAHGRRPGVARADAAAPRGPRRPRVLHRQPSRPPGAPRPTTALRAAQPPSASMSTASGVRGPRTRSSRRSRRSTRARPTSAAPGTLATRPLKTRMPSARWAASGGWSWALSR
jgi:hypothetical protein